MRKWLVGAGFHGALGVGFGAWAAHGAEKVLSAPAVDWVHTGSAYQLWHATALIGIAALAVRFSSRWLAAAGAAFCLGALGFSCSLYGLALGGPAWLVYVTPIGGALLILGWLSLLAAGFSRQSSEP